MLEQFKDKKIYFISDVDLDGIGSRVIFSHFFFPITNYIYFYNTADRSLPDFEWDVAADSDYVIFCDIAPPDLDFYNKLKDLTNVYIFDHHESARRDLGELKNYYYDIGRCGAKILYDFISPRRQKLIVRQFIDLVNCYDLWDYKSDLFLDAHDLHNAMYGYVDWRLADHQTDTEKYNEFIAIQLWKFKNKNSFYLTKRENSKAAQAKKKEQDNYRDARKSFMKRQDNQGNTYGYFDCTSKISWVSHLLLHEHEDLDYIVGYANYFKDTKVSLRARTTSPIDVSEIAKSWGGGGHPCAAGMVFEDYNNFIDFQNGKIHLR